MVKIYLDRQETPAIEMPLTDLLGGKSAPFIAPLCGERSRGWNSYFPIPYARHCKVTITKGNIYYIIDYRTYAEDVSVRTFTLQDAEAHSATIHAVAKTLDTPADAIAFSLDRTGRIDLPLIADMLGMDEAFKPRFVRRYETLGATIKDAVARYVEDVRGGAVARPRHGGWRRPGASVRP